MALIVSDFVLDVIEKAKLIREKLKIAQSYQKSYFDVRKRDLEFDIENWIHLKV